MTLTDLILNFRIDLVTVGWLTVIGLMLYVLWPALRLGIESHYVNKLEESVNRTRWEKEQDEKVVRGKNLDIHA